MPLYEITIKPTSPFGTPLKGDTIFGHFCWQMAHDQQLLNGSLEDWISRYPESPFAVFSSAWPRFSDHGRISYAFKRPDVPAVFLEPADNKQSRHERLKNRKENNGKKWLLAGEDLSVSLSLDKLLSDHDLFDRCLSELPENDQQIFRLLPRKQQRIICTDEQQHNTINRLTMTTGKGPFAPFGMENIHFLPGLELAIFAYTDKDATTQERLRTAFERIGQWGYGRDASTGLGRFMVIGCKEIPWPIYQPGKGCYTLSPCVPEKDAYSQSFFTPFTRFGKHGGHLALTGKPFKNPVVMADEGAVFYPDEPPFLERPYIGQAVTNLSKTEPKTVAQGYSLYLPL